MGLTIEQIRSASLAMRPVSPIELPALSSAINVPRLGLRALSGADMSEVFRVMGGGFDGWRFPRLVAGMSLVNAETGERLADADAVEELHAAMTADESASLRAASDILNRLTEAAREDAKKD